MRRSAAVIVKEMQGLVDELAEVVDDRLPSAEVAEAVVDVECLGRRVDAVFPGLVGQLDADGVYAEDGARSARAWLGWRLRLPASAATAVVHDARHLRRTPLTAAAFAAGAIGVAQVRQLRH